MTKRQFEKSIFAAFLKVCPKFASGPIKDWWQPENENEFPDVICELTSGEKIGVELAEWLNKDEMSTAKQREALEASFLNVIGEQGPNETDNIYNVWLNPKCQLKANDGEVFRQALFALITTTDHRWTTKISWQNTRGYDANQEDLKSYPVLMKYLESVRFNPSRAYTGWPPSRSDKQSWPLGLNWIQIKPESIGRDPHAIVDGLLCTMKAKLAHYGNAPTGLARISLVVHYDLALWYNTPETPLLSFNEAVNQAKRYAEKNRGPFEAIFAFRAVVENPIVIRIL